MALTGPDLPKVPTPLKSIQQYLTVALKHDQRDSVVSYWCMYIIYYSLNINSRDCKNISVKVNGIERKTNPSFIKSLFILCLLLQRDVELLRFTYKTGRLYALQTGLKLSTKTSEETNFLLKLMDWLEATKKVLHDNEAITNDVAAQAHLENWALKLFLYADKNDRAANFSKNVVQSFYTAQILYDVLTLFGELSVEAAQNRKYAQWKAAYIHNCLVNGETPVPGPMKETDDEDWNEASNDNGKY